MQVKLHHVYRHFKGNLYYVEDVALDCDTQERKVIYRALYNDHKLWVRDEAEFLEPLDPNKYPTATQKHRFEEMV